jgi:hypothetical protein
MDGNLPTDASCKEFVERPVGEMITIPIINRLYDSASRLKSAETVHTNLHRAAGKRLGHHWHSELT